MSGRWLAILAVVAVILQTSVAAAQSAPAAPSVAEALEAKKHFDVGFRLYNEHAVQEALAEFLLSYKLGGKAIALKNAAQCERDLKQFAQAYELSDKLLTVHGAQMTEPDRAGIRRALGELAILTGTIAIKVAEPGVDVTVDGTSIGSTPLAAPKRVNLGAHKIVFTKAGFEPAERNVSVSSEQAVEVALVMEKEVTTGHLAVRERAERPAHLVLDDKDVGPLPYVGDVGAGDHTIEARGDDWAAEKRSITVPRKDHVEIVLDAIATKGRLRVVATPTAARISIDGVGHGSGAWEGALPPGPHTIEVTLDGFPTATREITLARGENAVLEIPLTVVAGVGPAVPVYRGLYGRFNLLGAFQPTYVGYEPPASATGVMVNSRLVLGAGAALRIGYAFDWWSLEFVGMFSFIHAETRGDWGTAVSTSTSTNLVQTNGIETVLGAGARVTSKHDVARFTFGVAPALLIRYLGFMRRDPNEQCGGPCVRYGDFSGSGGYVAPAVVFDGGILLGSSPGVKFYLGLQAWIDLGKTLVVGPDVPGGSGNVAFPDGYFDGDRPRSWKATYGAEFFFGPALGIQFGH